MYVARCSDKNIKKLIH